MSIFKNTISKYELGEKYINNKYHKLAKNLNENELNKRPLRFDIINEILSLFKRDTSYLEIGVRNPSHNFDKIKADLKYSVDPGIEYESNPVDFQMTSDEFFNLFKEKKILPEVHKFDVVFIDGLHYAEQALRDIENSLYFTKNDGFVIVHDCNPPTEWHAREVRDYKLSPAKNFWNGTTWKAFLKLRFDPSVYTCCIDSDWGLGIISKKYNIGLSIENNNPFFDYCVFDKKRVESLNLCSFSEFKRNLTNSI